MESAKADLKFKFEQFEVSIVPFSAKKLSISVIDPFSKSEFKEQMLELTNIGTSTLMKALEQTMKEIKMAMKVVKGQNNTILQIDILVASQFLKPVQETIYLKKKKDILQSELIQICLERLSNRIKDIKNLSPENASVVLANIQAKQKSYNANVNYEPLVSVKLPKGNYILTISFLIKTSANAWMYLYLGNGKAVLQNSGFYVPNTTSFIPIVVRKPYSVTDNEEDVSFTTYYAQTYSFTLKNAVLSATKLM